MLRLSIINLLALLISLPLQGYAIGVSAAPATLSVRVARGSEAEARFTVANPSREVGLFEAYPEEFEPLFTLVPSRFVLEAGEKREVVVRIRGRDAGLIRTAIAVEAQLLGEPSLGVGGGVRLPVAVSVFEGSSLAAGAAGAMGDGAGSLFALVVSVLVGSLGFLLHRPRSSRAAPLRSD